MSQTDAAKSPAQSATELLAQRYGLDPSQQAQMLKIQERKFRNFSEIDPLKATDPQVYMQKVKAMQMANARSIERMLKADQLTAFRKQQVSLREKKALAFKEMKNTNASQQEIDKKMTELDLESM